MHVTKKGDNERWFRGYGPDQYVYYARQGPKKFLGGAFEVESREELEKVLKVPGATVLSDGIEEMKDAPGGGYIVTIADPEGFPVNFIWGQEPVREERKKPEKLLFNDEDDKPRQKAFQRFEPGPAEVHKVSTTSASHTRFGQEEFQKRTNTDWESSWAISASTSRISRLKWTGTRDTSTSCPAIFCTCRRTRSIPKPTDPPARKSPCSP
jgi:hypothetical protein